MTRRGDRQVPRDRTPTVMIESRLRDLPPRITAEPPVPPAVTRPPGPWRRWLTLLFGIPLLVTFALGALWGYHHARALSIVAALEAEAPLAPETLAALDRAPLTWWALERIAARRPDLHCVRERRVLFCVRGAGWRLAGPRHGTDGWDAGPDGLRYGAVRRRELPPTDGESPLQVELLREDGYWEPFDLGRHLDHLEAGRAQGAAVGTAGAAVAPRPFRGR